MAGTVGFLVCLALAWVAFSAHSAATENETIHAPPISIPLPLGRNIGDVTFACREKAPRRCEISDFMSYARVCALLVVKSGEIRLQRFNTDPNVCAGSDGPDGWQKMYGIASVTKSITSTLLGHAIATRYKAKSLAEFEAVVRRPVDDFIPELGNSGYAGISLERVLGMRSGIRWSESGWYGLFSNSAYFSLRVRNNLELGVIEFARKFRSKTVRHPSQLFNYSALDAAVAAAAAEKILKGRKLTDFLEAGLWASMGAEAAARWGVDKTGTAIGPCCFRLTVRDLARFGTLVLNKGREPYGRAVIPRAWFDLATRHRPGERDDIPDDNESFNAGCPLQYRYFWWLLPNRTDFTAI